MCTTISPDLATYDAIIVAFSGGKDSLACLLTLIDMGVDLAKVELWHHDIDGREGSALMDWAVTRAYCQAVAKAFRIPIYFSWLEGGFEREMLRDNTRKAPTHWENPDGTIGTSGGTNGKPATRLKFPQVSPDLSVRWCSSYLKIDVMSAALVGQHRFDGKRTLVITGERASESKSRANYETFEPYRKSNSIRHVDHWRPVHHLSTEDVWALIGRHRVNPHPAYRAGFGRVSCQFCIFGSANQCASARAISPTRFAILPTLETRFGLTIHRKESIQARADRGTPYPASQADIDACRSDAFDEPILLPEGSWNLPSGAFAESCGPL